MNKIKLVIFSLVLTLSLVNIFNIGILIKENYDLGTMKIKLKKISQENSNLEISLSQISNLELVRDNFQDLEFERIAKVYYIKPSVVSVAEK